MCETELTSDLTPELAIELANYVSHIRSYLEHYSFQNITPANYNNLWLVYFGSNLFTNYGKHYNIVDSAYITLSNSSSQSNTTLS